MNNFIFAWWGDFRHPSCLCVYHGSLQIIKIGWEVGTHSRLMRQERDYVAGMSKVTGLPPGSARVGDTQNRKGLLAQPSSSQCCEQHPHQGAAQPLPGHLLIILTHLLMTHWPMYFVTSSLAFQNAFSKWVRNNWTCLLNWWESNSETSCQHSCTPFSFS